MFSQVASTYVCVCVRASSEPACHWLGTLLCVLKRCIKIKIKIFPACSSQQRQQHGNAAYNNLYSISFTWHLKPPTLSSVSIRPFFHPTNTGKLQHKRQFSEEGKSGSGNESSLVAVNLRAIDFLSACLACSMLSTA